MKCNIDPAAPSLPRARSQSLSKLNKLGRGHRGDGEGLSLLLYHMKPAGGAAILIGKSPDSTFNPSPFLLSFPHAKATREADEALHLEPQLSRSSPQDLSEQGG